MTIIRSLDSFSLPELFKLIENDAKSGRLIIETPISQQTAKREGIYYIWFQDGYLIAVSNCLNQKGLINLIEKRSWISPAVVSRLRKLCPAGMPLGVYLHKMKLLNPEKLSLVFQLQLHQVYRLFGLTGGRFRFDDFAELQDRILTVPWLEMTGHRIKTSEASMYALRLISMSENFAGQLPAPNQVLSRTITQPHLKLTSVERQIWDFADRNTPLLSIAQATQHSISVIQITAFRLIAVGLLEAIIQPEAEWETANSAPKVESKANYAIALHSQEQDSSLDPIEEEKSFLNTIGSLFKKKNS